MDKAHQRYSDTAYEVGRLECCLNAVEMALATSERETATMQVVIANALACIMGKGSLHLVILFWHS